MRSNIKLRSLRVTLAISLAGLQLVAIVSVVLFTYFNSERATLRQSRTLLNEAGVNVISFISKFLDPARQTLDASRRLAENGVLALHDDAALERHLFQQLQVATQLAGIYYAEPSGRFVYVSRADQKGQYRTKIIDPFDFGSESHPARFIWRNDRFATLRTDIDRQDTYEARTRPWYTEVETEKVSIWTEPYIFFTGRIPGITYAAPVLDSSGNLRGVLGIDLQIRAISNFLSEIWAERRGAAIVMNESGEVIAHPQLVLIEQDADMDNPELTRINEIDDLIARAAFQSIVENGKPDGDDVFHSNISGDGNRHVAVLIPFPDSKLGWMIGIHAPEDLFIGEIRKDRQRGIWIAIAIAILTGLFGLKLADWINQPLRRFASQTRKVSEGEVMPESGLQSPYQELEETGAVFEQEIRRRQKFETAYGRTFDLASLGMAQIEMDTGKFLRVNNQLSDSLGFEEGELDSRSLQDVLSGKVDVTFAKFHEALLKDSEFIDECQFLRKDGDEVWLKINAILIRDEKGKPDHAVVTFDDVSEQRAAEETTARLQRDLSHVARVNVMGEMASGLAHELNQPLSAIAYSADAANMTMKELSINDDELTEILSDIESQALRAGDIIRALRSFVRKDRGRMVAFNMFELTKQAFRLLAPESKNHNIRLKVEGAEAPEVLGNRTQIAQVIVNLVRNAMDSIIATGQIDGCVTVTIETLGNGLRTTIKDNGSGIADDVMLFGQFDSLKPEGMGLGLSICKTIVEANDGKIWNEPTEHGAKFCFTLNLAESKEGGCNGE